MEFSDCVVAYQGGDSYPSDSYIEEQVRRRLPARFIDYTSTLAMYQGGLFTGRIAPRLETLRRQSDDLSNRNLILIGRSSGARIVTMHASTRPPHLCGVICLGYPFKHPKLALEPDRVAHLANLDVPTLILQGDTDDYGGAEAATRYHLSPRISFQVVRANHEFHISHEIWDDIGQRIRAFIEAL